MNKNEFKRLSFLAVFLLGGVVAFSGCEAKGPAQRAGENIDKGVQDAKDAVNPPGNMEKAGREVDKTLKQ